jgi:hypothetical protein
MRREQNTIAPHTQAIIILVHWHGVDTVGVHRRDGVQRREIKAIIVRELIKGAIGSKTDSAGITCTGIAYERRSARADVNGVQPASMALSISVRTNPVEHARAGLECEIADADWRAVVGDRADRGD